MTRKINLAVAQLGPIARAETREQVVVRLMEMMKDAAGRGAHFIVFPELALTTFFPRWYFEDQAEIDIWFETEMPNAATRPLFDLAAKLGVGFNLGYAELIAENGVTHHYNTSIAVDSTGRIIGKYRKVHLPGHKEYEAYRPWQHLEKRYFEPGNLGFPVYQVDDARVGMFICNDRRWPETWRVMGLRGAEIVCGGFNTPTHTPPVPQHDHLSSFHHLLSMQAGCYQNGVWGAAAAKAGMEEGSMLLANSCIVAPTGEIVALSSTLEDEVLTYVCDLDACQDLRDHIFNFAMHRQPQHYGIIAEMDPGSERS
ncbi:N-carbamoyl-D-amino-acid hydrolase [Paenirhodobacter populi]|uniref:N-carbamoyl-D-amino-acid hydrolase n=1 Tax=Paenirhodobacter populi TaxID=2306993 RepID=A0A443JCA0_9RHOB|nr:N-carbamoyl-D-amino-acid hydrolase [Sinirhodobacter populi]RWR18122.1 N-carbamoyl-D-amino-acid hydrolase [Sinirhodobacter populi]